MSSVSSASSASSATAASNTSSVLINLGMDVHKDSITIALPPESAKMPTRLDRLPDDLPTRKHGLARAARDGKLRACDEASGAGYVLHRAVRAGATRAR